MPDRIRIRSGESESTFSAPGPIVLGRDATDTAVVLDHRAVSRRHAQIAHDGQGWVLTDLKSSNGTWVDGNRINEPHRVSSATTIRLGMQQEGADIIVEPITETATPTETVETPIDQPEPLDEARIPEDDETRLFGTGALPDTGPALRAKLGGKAVTFAAVPGKKYTVGRDPDADLSTDEEIVSRNHVELAWNGEMWTATDVSARGTFNREGRPLPKESATPLAVSTILRLGGAASGVPLALTVTDPWFRRIRKGPR